MINADETQLPNPSANRTIDETLPPRNADAVGQGITLLPGESVAGSYIISALMNNQGKQSDVYMAKKWGKPYVIKIYHSGWRPSGQMETFLKRIRHPNIACVVDSGDYNGCYYEIYEYYSEGTLEETDALSCTHIQNVIIPSINEGLHELHRSGIIHCDIKPSNLFYADGGQRIVIGDCGISGYINSNGKLIDSVRGTPEYAPRVRALLWSASMSPAYDYGSFGLVLCRAILGHSIFRGMSVEEISVAWENGLELPSQISGRLGVLIRGLLIEDEDQRWGYSQVKRWCEGEYMRPTDRNIYARAKKASLKRPFIFGRFEDQTILVSSLHQLAQAIRTHWMQALHIVKRRELIDFVRQFDSALADKVSELALYQDTDAAAYKLLVYVEGDPQKIYYCGKEYESLSDYAEQLATGKDIVAKKFLSTGLLVFYLRENGYEASQIDKLERLIRQSGCDDMASVLTICFALQGKKAIDVLDASAETLNDLPGLFSGHSMAEIDEVLCDDLFIAWIGRLGYAEEMRKMKEMFSSNE